MTDGIQITIAPAFDEKGRGRIMIGFHSEHFSQCVNVPYIRHADTEALAKHMAESIVEASKKIHDALVERELGIPQNTPSDLYVP